MTRNIVTNCEVRAETRAVLTGGGFNLVSGRGLETVSEVTGGECRITTRRTALPEPTDVLWAGLNEYVGADRMPAGCRVIATPTTGLTHIDLDAAKARGITVLSLQGSDLSHVWATAEHTLALILALIRKIPAAVEHVREGGWDRDQFRGTELHGKVALVIGHGRVGRQVHHLLNAFGMSVYTSNDDDMTSRWAPHADIVTLHENYEPSKRGKYGAEFFDSLKPGAIFVNTARGDLVDPDSLWDAMELDVISASALDVVSDELTTRNKHYLANFQDRVIITPHLGGCTHESQAKTELILADKLIKWWSENG